MKTVTIKRSDAARYLEQLAENLGRWKHSNNLTADQKLELVERHFELLMGIPLARPCPGEAHSNPFIDHCGVCMPNWAWLFTKVKVT